MRRPRMHHLPAAGKPLLMNAFPAAGDRRGGAPAPWRRWRAPAVIVAVVVVAVATALVAAARAGGTGPGSTTRAVMISAAPAGTVDLQGVPGQLTIVAAATGRVTLTGQLHWSGHAPAVSTVLDRSSNVLHLSYRCAAASPCTENYRLVVPVRTAVVLQQPAGHVVLSGLAGPLAITAASVDISATGLRSPSLAVTIVSGHLGATFDLPPRRVSITLTSAQATLWLPASTGYKVSSHVTAGYVHVGIPQASGAARTITARISSGELELLPR
jgi:hypothetical protein